MRARRIAAAIGYVGTELAKEAPYYAGAFGAALLTDSISSNDALIFLGGANLGAAAYEYGLARLVRAFLQRRTRRAMPPSRPTGRRAITWPTTTARSSPTNARPSRSSSTPCGMRRPTNRSSSSASGRRSIMCSWPPAKPPRSISATTCRRTCGRSSGGSSAMRTPTTGVRSSATRSNAKACARPTEDEIPEREDLTRAKITRLLEVDIRSDDPLGERERRLRDRGQRLLRRLGDR